MKVIILAGGKGTRLPHSAKNIPKSLVKIGRKTILQYQIDLLKKHGLTDIRLSLGYKSAHIIDYTKGKYEYVIESQPLGTGGAIKFAAQDLKDDFMVLNGDVLSNADYSKLLKFYKKNVAHGTKGVIVVFYVKDARHFGLVKIKNGKIIKFLEKPEKKCPGYINAGIYMLSPAIFKNVSRETFSIEYDIFPKLAHKKHLAAFVHNGNWIDVGTEERLQKARKNFIKK